MRQMPRPTRARTAEEVGQLLARGRCVEATPELADECGAIPDLPDELEDALAARRDPYLYAGPRKR